MTYGRGRLSGPLLGGSEEYILVGISSGEWGAFTSLKATVISFALRVTLGSDNKKDNEDGVGNRMGRKDENE